MPIGWGLPPPWGGVGQPLIETLQFALMGLAPALASGPRFLGEPIW